MSITQNAITKGRQCAVDGCEKKRHGHGYCIMHYKRLLRHGDVTVERTPPKHGMHKTRVYSIWEHMISRCQNNNNGFFKDYGGRGVKVCDRWKNFIHFLEDMGEPPAEDSSIDRINVNGNYEPSNCRWADRYVQSRNTRKQLRKDCGVTYDKSRDKWQARIGVNGKKIHLGRFNSKLEAIKARRAAELEYWDELSKYMTLEAALSQR